MDPKALQRLKESFSIFYLLFILVGNKPALAAATPKMEDCEPKRCRNSFDITFPFWLSGEQQSYCGYPPFKLTCGKNDSYPYAIEILDFKYYVLNISYDNQSFLVTPGEFVDETCPLPPTNLTVNSSLYPLGISPNNTQIYFLVNCSSDPVGLEYKRIACATDQMAYYGGLYDGLNQRDLGNTSCALRIVPVKRYSEANKDDYSALLRSGMLVNWTSPDCAPCQKSGGSCGYNEANATFMCICPDQVQPYSCNSPRSHAQGKHTNKLMKIIIGLASAGAFLLLCTGFLFYRCKKKQGFSPSSKSLIRNASLKPPLKDPEMGSDHFQTQTHVFSYAELEEATNCFDASKELGDGGFGTVYKGKLQDGRTVAVKRLYENNYRRLEQFMNEIVILSRLRHQNLVSLYGCTSRHSRELLLVYEFVSNGTVADHLHGPRASEGILTWPMRLSIAIEMADALSYLHAINPPIIHRDVKTSNILLDASFHVKVADFGLSRLIPTDVTHISTAPQGTPGYLDPEYHQCYQLTDKSDVYSFGVVLVELISSKPAVDISRRRSEINLANMAITRIQNGELEELVDNGLGYQSDQATRKMITMVAEVAFRCLQSDGDMRPPIKEVVEVLRAIESEGHKVEKKEQQGAENRDDAELLKNTTPLSPDTVMNNWASRSTTPNTSG